MFSKFFRTILFSPRLRQINSSLFMFSICSSASPSQALDAIGWLWQLHRPESSYLWHLCDAFSVMFFKSTQFKCPTPFVLNALMTVSLEAVSACSNTPFCLKAWSSLFCFLYFPQNRKHFFYLLFYRLRVVWCKKAYRDYVSIAFSLVVFYLHIPP